MRLIKNRVAKNASWIIACQIAKSVIALVISLITARYLGPSNFGLISYASSIATFVVPVVYLGLNSTLVHEIINSKDEEGTVLGSSLFISLISSILCILGIVAFVLISSPGETDTLIVCALYSTILIFNAVELLQYWFQAKLMSKYTSIIMLISYVVVALYKIVLLVTHKSVYWFALSNSFDAMLIAVGLLTLYRKFGSSKLRVSLKLCKELFSRSRYYIVSSLMVAIFTQTDKVMLKLMLSDSATGYYTVAVNCAHLTAFVFSAIIDSARPSILESKGKNEVQYQKKLSYLYSIIIYLSLAQSVFMTLLARPIILILYGTQYLDSVVALRFVVWYSTFSYIGAIRSIWILAEQKQKYLWIINLSGALANIFLNYCLIPQLGITGAALASLITQIFTNIFIAYIIRPIKESYIPMLNGANPKVLISAVKELLR